MLLRCPQDCVLADGSVNADSEATGAMCWRGRLAICWAVGRCSRHVPCPPAPAVLAAAAQWFDRNLQLMPAAQRKQRIDAICSLVRFPSVPPVILLSLYAAAEFLQEFDPDGQLLTLAVSSVAGTLLAATRTLI